MLLFLFKKICNFLKTLARYATNNEVYMQCYPQTIWWHMPYAMYQIRKISTMYDIQWNEDGYRLIWDSFEDLESNAGNRSSSVRQDDTECHHTFGVCQCLLHMLHVQQNHAFSSLHFWCLRVHHVPSNSTQKQPCTKQQHQGQSCNSKAWSHHAVVSLQINVTCNALLAVIKYYSTINCKNLNSMHKNLCSHAHA